MGSQQTGTTAAAALDTQRNTRSRLTEKAASLFADRGYDKTSVADIAKAADAFPNQITHHFGSKEALFVEAARYAMLRTAKRAEDRSRDTETPEAHARSLISYLLGPGSGPVMMFAEAMLIARRTPRLQTIVSRTSAELYHAGESAMVETFIRTGWQVGATPGAITRGFWTAVLGLAVEKAALGEQFDDRNAEAVVVMLMRMNATVESPANGPFRPDEESR